MKTLQEPYLPIFAKGMIKLNVQLYVSKRQKTIIILLVLTKTEMWGL